MHRFGHGAALRRDGPLDVQINHPFIRKEKPMQTMIETKDLTFAYPAEEGKEPRAALKDVNV